MYLNDLNSAKHNVDKLNRILADTFNHEVDLSEMSTDSLNRMLNTTQAKMMAIKETDLKYWENSQYNKLGLIQHQLKTFISEIAPARVDGKAMKPKSESVVMEDELEQAEVMLAAQELVDELQKMVEDIAEMQVQKLMPIVDAMKEQVGFAEAEAYNNAVDSALGGLLDQSKSAKDAVENATLSARGEAPASPMQTDMAMDQEAPAEEPMDIDASDEFSGDDAAAGEDNSIGRELKGESALADMEGKALAEKKFLESKDKLFKMVESGKMTQEHFINIISELDNSKDLQEDSIAKQRRKSKQDDISGMGMIQKQRMTPPDDISGMGMIQKQKMEPVPMPRMAPKPDMPSPKPVPMPRVPMPDKGVKPRTPRPMPQPPQGGLRPPKPRGGIADTPSGPPLYTLPAPPGLPGGDPLIHGGEPKPKANPNRPGGPFNPKGKPDPMRNARFAKG